MSSDLEIIQSLIKGYTKDDVCVTITELLEFDKNGKFTGLTNTYNNVLNFYNEYNSVTDFLIFKFV